MPMMLLQSISLNNIRSYQQQTVNFQKGITLLSGDIGSGKSSILLAIEFALFGASRPDLPAESLLRKGATKADVTLNFTLGGNQITIHRTLQLTKQGVRQGSGYIIQNNQKFELTAVELKAKIIELLGYPEDQINKGKNYIYRYTIYCPQEEMKHILQDSPDNRLDILRKIFNIEKYKLVRENIVSYLKTLRKEITVLQTRVEGLPTKEQDLLAIQDSLAKSLDGFSLQSEKTAKLSKEHSLIKNQLKDLQLKNQKRTDLLNEQKTVDQLILSLNEQKISLESNLQKIVQEKEGLLVSSSQTIDRVEAQINESTEKLQSIRDQKHEFDTKSGLFQKQIVELKEQLTSSSESKDKLDKISIELKEIEVQVSKKGSLKEQKESIDQQIKKSLQQKATIQAQISQLNQKEESISKLTHCPTCEQDVPVSHCQKIKQDLNQKRTILQSHLQSIVGKESEFEAKQLEVNQILQKISLLEKNQTSLLQEQAKLQTLVNGFDKIKENLKQKVLENNSLMSNFKEFLSLKFPLQTDLQKHIVSLQKRKDQILLLQQIQKQELQIKQELTQISEKNLSFKEKKASLSSVLSEYPDFSWKVLELEKTLELSAKSLESEKMLLTKLEQIIIHQKESRKKLSEEITVLQSVKSQLLVYQERSRWIDGHFIPLTQHIEKEIMLKIYQYCNDLFAEWFELLTEGSELSASLDSAFTPVITQQGHSISFTYLSGGERTAASLAYRLALTKAVNGVLQQMKTKELLILDEPTDGFSAEQLQRLRDCLEAIGLKQIIIVSHEAMMEGFVNHIIHVEKRSGVSITN